MRILLALLALGLSAQEELDVERGFRGDERAALRVIRELGDEEPERAVAIARDLRADAERPEALRAELAYAEGVVLGRAGLPDQAVPAFASARALAGPGALRADATYNQGTVELERAEALRAETLRALSDPQAPAQTASAQDPLDALERAFLAARRTLASGLADAVAAGADAGDDLRANLELIQRRLREIERLRQEREQEQEQQQEQQDPGQEEPQGEPEPSEDESQEDPRQEQPQAQPPEPGDPQGEREPGEPPPDTGSEPGPDQPPPAEPVDPAKLPEPQVQADDQELEERVLSREQVLRLLERLEELEQERLALEEALRATRRVPVEKDW